MVVVLSSSNLLIWSNTSQKIREHWHILYHYVRGHSDALIKFDFGIGTEYAYRCDNCGRFCPIQTATIDHYVPRSRIRIVTFDIDGEESRFDGTVFRLNRKGMISVFPHNMDKARRLHYTFQESVGIPGGGYIFCEDPITHGVLYRWEVMDLALNLVNNLQPLCAYCNSSKGTQ